MNGAARCSIGIKNHSILITMKRILAVFPPLILAAGIAQAKLPALEKGNLNFIVLSDTGAAAEEQQVTRQIAADVGKLIMDNNIAFVALAGDHFHDKGVQSVDDSLWKIRVEEPFSAPALHSLPWYVIQGNHEYPGNIQANLDYSSISPRWNAPSRYFAFERSMGYGNLPVLFVFIDTTPMIDFYRENMGDAGEQDLDRALHWLDSTLVTSKAKWKVVIGHHPVYAEMSEFAKERSKQIQPRIGTILEKRNTDIYISGHTHTFQYLRPQGTKVHYVVNGAGRSKSKPSHPTDKRALQEGTVVRYEDPGFSLFSISDDELDFYFINNNGETLYHRLVKK
jgi:UDP-2,3-diacylglucosamine pyrophosphatase LpxH